MYWKGDTTQTVRNLCLGSGPCFQCWEASLCPGFPLYQQLLLWYLQADFKTQHAALPKSQPQQSNDLNYEVRAKIGVLSTLCRRNTVCSVAKSCSRYHQKARAFPQTVKKGNTMLHFYQHYGEKRVKNWMHWKKISSWYLPQTHTFFLKQAQPGNIWNQYVGCNHEEKLERIWIPVTLLGTEAAWITQAQNSVFLLNIALNSRYAWKHVSALSALTSL